MPWHAIFFQNITLFLTFRDCIEITLCSIAIYYFSLWLKQDRQKNLLFSFYGYCAIVLGSYYASLPTVTLFLFITFPFALMLFVLFHQELLQKNFIALAAIKTHHEEHDNDWLETIIRACLVAINNNKTIHGVIEHRDSLATMLTTSMPLYADIQKNVLAMALESSSYDQEKLLWISAQGKLLGINTAWNSSPSDIQTSHGITMLPSWQQEALFFTHKTDAIVFSINPTSRTFTLVAQGKIIEHINAAHALITIKKFLNLTPTLKGDVAHEVQSKSNLKNNATLKVVSLILGYGLWNIVSSCHTHTLSISAPVCFYNEPSNHTIDAPEYIALELQGKKKSLRALNTKTLALHIDACQLHHGPNQLRIDRTTLFLPETINVVHYSPTNIVATVTEKKQA